MTYLSGHLSAGFMQPGPGEMFVVVTLYVSKNKKMNINEAQSKLHSIGPKLKLNLVTDFDETNG